MTKRLLIVGVILLACAGIVAAVTPFDLATSLRDCVYSIQLKNDAPNRSRLAQCKGLADQLVSAMTPPPPPPPACAYTVSPLTVDIPASGGVASFAVTASDSNCAWSVSTASAWLLNTVPTSGTGNATVTLTVAANTTTTTSVGTLTIAGIAVTVTQPGTVAPPPPSSTIGRVFGDDFETGTTALWAQDDYHARCTVVTTAVDAIPAHGGTRAAQCNWNGLVAWNDPYAYTGLKLDSWAYTREFLVRIWVRYALDVDHKMGNKALRLYSNGGGTNSYYFDAQMERSPSSMFSYWERVNNQSGAIFWGDSVALGDGAWHKVEIYVKHNTSGQADGVTRVWLDDDLKQESVNIVSTTPGGRWYPLYLVSNWSNNPGWEHDANNHVLWDDAEIFSDQGTGGSGLMSDGSIVQP